MSLLKQVFYKFTKAIFHKGGIIAKREYSSNLAAEIIDNAVKRA